ncbi:MAG: hypothetical protein FWC27_01400 [Firmicutes bacterium]|nr:hypothetical protein [Bacillota bacterium]
MIPNLTIGDLQIDCTDPERARDFYAALTGYEQIASPYGPSLKTPNGLTILFAGLDIPHAPPVWPEEPGKQQKQMHLDFGVDHLRRAVKRAIRLGATKAAKQYNPKGHITMLDPDGHPFCLCLWQKSKAKGTGAILSCGFNADCRKTEDLRAFYAELTPWDQSIHHTALEAEGGFVVHFMQADFDYIPPVWPEEPGRQQKQMHFNFQADDLPSAVEEALRLGAAKAAAQYGGAQFVTMIDPDGHPFCLCKR